MSTTAVAKQKAMKVLSHEDDVLKNGYGAELAAIKREYYRICVGLVEDLAKAEGLKSVGSKAATGGVSTRTAVMGLVWHDELALHLVQPARRSRCRGAGAGDQRHLSAWHPFRESDGQAGRRARRKRKPRAGQRKKQVRLKKSLRWPKAEAKHVRGQERKFQPWVAPSQPRPERNN